ncbi:MAG: hypothetical protein M1833_003961 [Piccolia ochrophora]|nr:MAG: hypothetical protein M1833_003961 [Piccolia ochrophora]
MAGYIQKGLKNILQKLPNDVVILSSIRTPVTRAKKGGLKDAYPEELLAAVLKATLSKNPNLDPALIQDVSVGSVLQELGGAKAGRMAMNHVGYPATTAFHTINRQCSSGLAAITSIAHSIALGELSIGVGAGMESMTRNYGSRAIPTDLWPALRDSPSKDARDCIMSMGLTSENVAARYSVSRADQDAFAARSHQKAAHAQRTGLFDAEIVPVTTRWTDPDKPDVSPGTITVDADDGIRPSATPESLAKLKPAFAADGSSTAGNSSQVSDGAAATLLMRRSTASSLGLSGSIIGKWAGTQVVGCHPDEMGVGPAVAIPKLLHYTGLARDDVGVWEINEAFASQVLYCLRELRIDEDKVNPKGGAIALGHPLGATGARQVATLLPEMERRGVEVGVVSMCCGTGMGVASLFVRE